MHQDQNNKFKIAFIFFLIFLSFLVLIGDFIFRQNNDIRLPKLKISETDRALRGKILSKNRFTIGASKKLYKAVVDTRNIDPDKEELFIELFSAYSNIPKKRLRRKIRSHFGFVTLSYKLDSLSARYAKQLIPKLFRLGILRRYRDPNTGDSFLHSLNIVESGEYRIYPRKDTLTPIIGFVRKREVDGYTTVYGVYGLEKYYDDRLSGIQSTEIVGRRDIRNHIIFDKRSEVKNRIDGYNVRTSIDLKLQRAIEKILDEERERTGAKEIIAAVMESKTGNILSIASSRRFDPGHITDNESINISAIRYLFEPGSVLKPITFALLLELKKVKPDELVKTFNGRFQLGRKVITDEHSYPYLSAEDVIVHSSNIGIAQLAQRLDQVDFFQGLRDFGFSKKSGIDLPYELPGDIPNIYRFKNSIFKATAAYGYGMRVNFFQLLSAYNIFNNDGRLMRPTIGYELESTNGYRQRLFYKNPKRVLPENVARTMRRILIKTVEEGTGKATITPGLEIGGKTGTAQIALKGRYRDLYNSSFFGFANDTKHRYTIGVTVIEPDPEGYIHFASQSAVPVFKKIVDEMVRQRLLNPQE